MITVTGTQFVRIKLGQVVFLCRSCSAYIFVHFGVLLLKPVKKISYQRRIFYADIIDFNVPEYSILGHTKPADSVFRGSDWLLKLRVVFTSVGSLKLSNNFREGGGEGEGGTR